MVRSEPEPDRPSADGPSSDWPGAGGTSAESAAEERRRLDDELIGLDRDDPEVRAFSEHLKRAHRERPSFTVEGYLSGVTDFADSANRAQGLKRLGAVLVVGLILLGVAVTLWEASLFVVSTLLG
ncbi:MAG TPA: hypothetical protein VGI84_09885 [Pseudonocardiaceae bacterium]